MELAFVVSALRRRFWVVTLLALLGSIPGLTADPPVSTTFRSTALLLVQAPTRAEPVFTVADPDRYVVSQLSVLESASLHERVANRVAAQLGIEISGADVSESVEIEHEPGTDIVEVRAEGNSGAIAAATAQNLADLYVEGLATTDEDQEQRATLERQIQELENQLEGLDNRIQASMEPFLPRRGVAAPPPIPPIEMVDPDAVSRRTVVTDELLRLKASLNELDQASRLRVNTEIISSASVPTEPIPAGPNFILVGGLAAGIMAGIIVALMWARFSTKVLDEDAAGEIMGAPVACEIPHYRSLARNPLAAFQSLPRSAVPTVDQLCVRAEALARIGEPLTVVVTGTMRTAGATTIALAMAERFAAGGASVVLVDADVHDPRITSLFNGSADGGVPAVIANGGALTDQRGRSVLTRTMDPAVSVLGLGPNRGAASLRRDTVPNVLDAARRNGEIVVIDGGPMLDLASTIQFANLVDAVVMAVPLSRQKADALTDMARQLDSVRSKLLPVITSPSRRPARGPRPDGSGGGQGRMPINTNGTTVIATDAANGHLVPSGQSAADIAAGYGATTTMATGVHGANGGMPGAPADTVVETVLGDPAQQPQQQGPPGHPPVS
ncbi:MAG: hypothetical protein AAGD35_14600 [Actinomycetota bacterium]